jgi:hypothetical protein
MRHSFIAAAVAICVALDVHAQGAGATASDMPGHPSFRAGARLLAGDDWTSTDIGDIPESLRIVGGTAEIVEERGRRFLRVSGSASFDVLLPEHLPESYTIDFDMRVPASTGYSVEIRPDLAGSRAGYAGVSRRTEHPVVLCGAIGSGVYGTSTDARKRFDDRFAAAMVPCQIVVTAKSVKVYFAGQLAANVPGASLGRTNRVRVHVPADEGTAALIGPIRVATDVGADLAASSERSPADTRSRPVEADEAPASEPARDTAGARPQPEPEAAASSATRSTLRDAASGGGFRGIGNRIRRRAEARATARADSAASKVEQKADASAEKALDTANGITDKAVAATDRIVSCLVTDLRCVRRARRAGAQVAVTDSTGRAVSSADSARAVARASQQNP